MDLRNYSSVADAVADGNPLTKGANGGIEDAQGGIYTDSIYRYDKRSFNSFQNNEVVAYNLPPHVRHVHLSHIHTDDSDGGSRYGTLNINSGLPSKKGSRIKLSIYSYRYNNSGSGTNHGSNIAINSNVIVGPDLASYIANGNTYEGYFGAEVLLTDDGWIAISKNENVTNS